MKTYRVRCEIGIHNERLYFVTRNGVDWFCGILSEYKARKIAKAMNEMECGW